MVAKSWGGFSGYEDRARETKRRAALSDWRVDTAKMAVTDEAGFMHCLPVRRNVVVTDDVIDGPGSWVQEEAELRLYTTIALLEKMMQARARSGSVTWSE